MRVVQHPNWDSDFLAEVIEEGGRWGVRLDVKDKAYRDHSTQYFKPARTFEDAIKVLADIPQRFWFEGDWVGNVPDWYDAKK